jgi:hypothetical protein
VIPAFNSKMMRKMAVYRLMKFAPAAAGQTGAQAAGKNRRTSAAGFEAFVLANMRGVFEPEKQQRHAAGLHTKSDS